MKTTFKTSDTVIEVPYKDSGVMVVLLKNAKVEMRASLVKHEGKVTLFKSPLDNTELETGVVEKLKTLASGAFGKKWPFESQFKIV